MPQPRVSVSFLERRRLSFNTGTHLKIDTPIGQLIMERNLYVAFQPIVDIRTHTTFAYEALVRTNSKDFSGPPAMFDAAVEAECAGQLGRLIRQVAVDGCSTHPLFLNVHPSELNQHFIVQPDDPIFRHSEEVFLEITEAVPLSHFRLCQNILHEVRGRGVYLVVDDLGAGYSNLKYIADLHPRIVKLDRGLIEGLSLHSRLFKLVKSIVVLCRDLGAQVVAEGIETRQELEAVREAGAHYAQGYLLARPAFPMPKAVWPEGL